MANEIRTRFNFVSGTLSSSLTNVATSMSAAGLANLGVIDSTNYAAIAIENEIVWVTAHTAGATTATILRAQEGTSAVAHNSGVAWQHGPTAADVLFFAVYRATGSGWTASTSFTAITSAQLVLPAGKWWVEGFMRFSTSTGTARSINGRIRNTTDGTDVDTGFVGHPATQDQGPTIVMAGEIDAAASKTVRLEALVSALDGVQNLSRAKIWAKPVAALL